MKPGAYFVNTARETLIDEEALLEGLRSGPPGRRRARRLSPSPAGRPSPAAATTRTSIVTAHVGGATFETLRHGGEMAVDEIERFAAGEPLVNVANRRALDASPRRRSQADELPPRDRPRHGQLPRGPVRRGRHARSAIGQREWTHAALPGVPGSQVFDTAPELGADLRLHPRGAGHGGRPGRRIAARQQHQHARGHGAVRRARGARSGPARTSTRARRAEATELVESGRAPPDLRAGWRLGVDHLAGPVPVDHRHTSPTSSPPSPTSGMLSDWVLYRLDRPLRDRPLVRLELGPVRPPRRGPGRRHRSSSSTCRRPIVPEVLEPGTVVGASAREPPRRPASGPGRPSSSAAPTRSSAWSASASCARTG